MNVRRKCYGTGRSARYDDWAIVGSQQLRWDAATD